jgi:hypothetical protein
MFYTRTRQYWASIKTLCHKYHSGVIPERWQVGLPSCQRVARMSGAPFDSIRRQLGATRAAISGGYTRISPAAVPSAASLAHAGYANLTGNCWVAGIDGCAAGWMVPSRERSEGSAELRLCVLPRFCRRPVCGRSACGLPIGLPAQAGRGCRTVPPSLLATANEVIE